MFQFGRFVARAVCRVSGMYIFSRNFRCSFKQISGRMEGVIFNIIWGRDFPCFDSHILILCVMVCGAAWKV